MQAPLDRHSPNKHHLPVARWMEVGCGGEFLPSGWPHYPATRFDLSRCYWITSVPTKATAHPVKRSGALQQWRAIVANAKRCHILSTAAKLEDLQWLHSADDVATWWLITYSS